jgi:hypothetical protein
MTEPSLILRDWEVRGIIEGRIRELRRPIKPQPIETDEFTNIDPNCNFIWKRGNQRRYCGKNFMLLHSPFGQVGGTIWGKETWCEVSQLLDCYGKNSNLCSGVDIFTFYRASHKLPSGCKWRSPVHMPREYSRIILQTDEVWTERLQEISEEDALAMGIIQHVWRDSFGNESPANFKESLMNVWDLIYKSQGLGWEVNPYVFAAKVHRVEVDKLG